MSNVTSAKNYIPGLGDEFLITADGIDPEVFNSLGYLQANKVAYQAHSVATDAAGIVTDFNTLLDKLVAAGIMAAS